MVANIPRNSSNIHKFHKLIIGIMNLYTFNKNHFLTETLWIGLTHLCDIIIDWHIRIRGGYQTNTYEYA